MLWFIIPGLILLISGIVSMFLIKNHGEWTVWLAIFGCIFGFLLSFPVPYLCNSQIGVPDYSKAKYIIRPETTIGITDNIYFNSFTENGSCVEINDYYGTAQNLWELGYKHYDSTISLTIPNGKTFKYQEMTNTDIQKVDTQGVCNK
jgi:hypothetical protein